MQVNDLIHDAVLPGPWAHGAIGMKPCVAINVEDNAWREAVPDLDVSVADTVSVAMNMAIARSGNVRKKQETEISLLFTNNQKVQALNAQYRGADRPTNVLSFPGHIDQDSSVSSVIPLGDIALAFELIDQEAAAQGKSVSDHMSHLIVHGLLHLLGYDHKHDRDAVEMEQLERRILMSMGLHDPYEIRLTDIKDARSDHD